MKFAGGCHCGAVRFEIALDDSAVFDVLDCNCSICAKSGYLHLIVAHDDFRLLRGRDQLTSYRFGSGMAEHLFCRICGIKSFYQPRSHPEGWSVNLRCLEGAQGLKTRIRAFDGRNWEAAHAGLGGQD